MIVRPYLCDFERDEPELYRQVMQYIPGIEGKPFVRICGFNNTCFIGEKMYGLRVFEAQLEGQTDWSVSIDDYPDDLFEGFWIAYDCLVLHPEYILDRYFKYYYVFTPELIALARANDLSFVDDFLRDKET